MTATPAPALTAAELAVVQAFDAAPTPPEVVEAAVLEEVARAIMDADYDQATGGLMEWSDLDGNEQGHFRSLAVAAIAAYRAAQDGGAEEAVRRVLIDGNGTHDCPACDCTGALRDERTCPLCDGWGYL